MTELTARIKLLDAKPHLISVNETFLDRSVKDISLEGYALVT